MLEVSTQPNFTGPTAFRAIRRTSTSSDLTIKIQARRLRPDTQYFYRWRQVGNLALSETGTLRTAPLPTDTNNVRFAYSGDSDGTQVLGEPFFNDFEALDAARAEGLDFFVYLGDLIYSDSFVRDLSGLGPAETLDEYRETWKVNRSIAALPDLLAETSIFAIWDDHEVRNDYDGQTVDPQRYANGRQAYFEYVPGSETGLPVDPTCAGDPLFRVFSWGSEVDLLILDERSCRSSDVDAACEGDLAPALPSLLRALIGLPANPPAGCLDALNDPSRTLLGPVQKQLFKEALLASTATFKFVINELPIQELFVLPYDRWEGYAAERAEILSFVRDEAIENVLFLATDIHANLVNEVFVDFFADSQPVASEFVTGPIARTTFAQNVLLEVGAAGLAAIQGLLADVLEVECQALDDFSYGLVEVDATTKTATITLKDDTGSVLLDDLTGEPCSHTVGP